MTVTIQLKRGTREQLDYLALRKGLSIAEPFLITDENRLAIATSSSTYESFALTSEILATLSGLDLLNLIKTVDGAGTGLDADLLDGLHAGSFALSNHVHNNYLSTSGGTVTGAATFATITHTGLTPSEGTNIDQITTITKYLTLTTDWQDTGIKSTDLATGTYIVQLYASDAGGGGNNINEYYSGTMSWYSAVTDSSLELPTDEIALHRAGASGFGGLYLRTYRSPANNADSLRLQIYSNTGNTSASNYVFKFRRVI